LIFEGRVESQGTKEFLVNDPISRQLYLGERFKITGGIHASRKRKSRNQSHRPPCGVTDAIVDYARKKVESLHLDYPRIIEAQVILDVEKYRHIAEVVLRCNNHITSTRARRRATCMLR